MKRIINEYIEYTKKSIKQYMKMIFLDNVDSEIVEEFMVTYVNVRYYNIYNGKNNKKSFYVRVTEELNRKYNIIAEKYRESARKNKITLDLREKKEKAMSSTKEIFELLIIWDNVKDIDSISKNSVLKNSIDVVERVRKKYYNINSDDEFKEALLKKIKDDLLKKDIYLDDLDSGVFSLSFKKNKNKRNMFYTKLENNIHFPMVYSSRIIDKIFAENVIAEECMKVEFTLLSAVIIRDLVKGNFNDIYIVDVPEDLLKKKTKMENILNNINTQVLQDKIYLKIFYSDYVKNIVTINKFISIGYKFVIEIDKTFKNVSDLENLKIFKYVLLNDKLKNCEEILKQGKKYDNILEK